MPVLATSSPLEHVVSHWSTLIEGFQTSPLEFYTSVEEAIVRRQVPETANSRVEYGESGVLSARREYLHVQREHLVFDICGAHFGTGFFVSYWLAEDRFQLNAFQRVGVILAMPFLVGMAWNVFGFVAGTIVLIVGTLAGLAIVNNLASEGKQSDDWVRALPLVGRLYEWLFKSSTYYRIDTTQMFQKSIHNAVMEVIDEMTKAKGLRMLSESERKPVMREFFTRKGN